MSEGIKNSFEDTSGAHALPMDSLRPITTSITLSEFAKFI